MINLQNRTNVTSQYILQRGSVEAPQVYSGSGGGGPQNTFNKGFNNTMCAHIFCTATVFSPNIRDLVC